MGLPSSGVNDDFLPTSFLSYLAKLSSLDNFANTELKQELQKKIAAEQDRMRLSQASPASVFELDIVKISSAALNSTDTDRKKYVAEFKEYAGFVIGRHLNYLQNCAANSGEFPEFSNMLSENATKAKKLQDQILALDSERGLFPQQTLDDITKGLKAIEFHTIAKTLVKNYNVEKLCKVATKMCEQSSSVISSDRNHRQELESMANELRNSMDSLSKIQFADPADMERTKRQMEEVEKNLQNLEKERIRCICNQANQNILQSGIATSIILDLASTYARKLGAPPGTVKGIEIAKKIVGTGIQLAVIAKNIINWTAITAASGPMAPVVAILGALQTISGIFIQDRSITNEEIFDAIQGITRQIQQLEQVMLENFRETFRLILAVDQRAQERFDQLDRYCVAILQSILELHLDVLTVKEKLDGIVKQINAFNNYFREIGLQVVEIYDQKYLTEAKTIRDGCCKSSSRLSDREVGEFISASVIRATIEASSAILSKTDEIRSAAEVAKELIALPVPRNINLLRGFVKYLCPVVYEHDFSMPFVNPDIWIDAVKNLLFVLERTPSFEFNEKIYQSNLDAILAKGKELQKFIVELKTNPIFFLQLFECYKIALLRLKTAFVDSFVSYGRYQSIDDYKEKILARRKLQMQLAGLDNYIREQKALLIAVAQQLFGERIDDEQIIRDRVAHFVPAEKVILVPVSDGEMIVKLGSKERRYAKPVGADAKARFAPDISNFTAALMKEQTEQLTRLNDLLKELTALHINRDDLKKIIDGSERANEDALTGEHIAFLSSDQGLYAGYQGFLHEALNNEASILSNSLWQMEQYHKLLISFAILVFDNDFELQKMFLANLKGRNEIKREIDNLVKPAQSDENAKKLLALYLQQELFANTEDLKKKVLTKILELKRVKSMQPVCSYMQLDKAIEKLEQFLTLMNCIANPDKPIIIADGFDSDSSDSASDQDMTARSVAMQVKNCPLDSTTLTNGLFTHNLLKPVAIASYLDQLFLNQIGKIRAKKAASISDLSNEIEKYKFDQDSLREVDGDGSCFYHALLDQLRLCRVDLNVNSVDELRDLIGKGFEVNLEKLKDFVEHPADRALAEILQNGWAGPVEIQLASFLLNINIVIINSDGTPPIVYRRPHAVATICLGYEVIGHYWSLRKPDGTLPPEVMGLLKDSAVAASSKPNAVINDIADDFLNPIDSAIAKSAKP